MEDLNLLEDLEQCGDLVCVGYMWPTLPAVFGGYSLKAF